MIYHVSSGTVEWRGEATDDNDALRKAFGSAEIGATFGEFYRIKASGQPSKYARTVPMLRDLGFIDQ